MENQEELGNSIMTIRYKIVFVGDISVGKSAVVNRFIKNSFSGDYDVNKKLIFLNMNIQATIGVDFFSKRIDYKNNSLKIQIWDSAGQERYKSLIPSYVRGSSLIFILFDVSNKNTFDNLINWINFIKQINNEESIMILCGNKIDLPREISANEAKNLAEKNNMFYFETSAKTGDGINHMIYSCIALLPFFEKFKIENNDALIQELMKTNSDSNEYKEINVKNRNKNNLEKNGHGYMSSNIVLKKNDSKDYKKHKCLC